MLKKRLVVLLVSLIIIFFIFSLVSSTGSSENQCYQDSDCGPVTESPIFCSGSDLYKNVTIPECVFYGSPGFICLYSYEKILIQHCDLGCSNNQCNEQELTCVEAKDLGLLTGSIINGLGTVINHANQSFEVGLAVYEKFDENIDNQILFDSETGVVLNQSNLTLSVSLPLCAYQIDLFCGPVLQNFSQGERYAERLISAMHSTSIPLCIDEQEPVCSNGILETGEQCDDGNQNNNDGCSSQCIIETIVCSEDIDCGTDGFIQGPFCLANNVTRQFQNFTCNYPGQYNSFCSSVIENKTLEICNYQCSLGSCIEPICGNNITELGEDCDDGNSIDGDGCSSQCMLEDLQARIIFRKIVCNSESDLPNWASTNITINNQTAQDFINSHQNCYFQENWSFQWWIGKGENNPGDNTGFSPLWHNITPTDSSGKTSVIYPINDVLSRLVWFREVFQSGYIPFTGINTNQNVSAEFYCHDDVQFYDNREGITFTQEGNYAGDYYCIAFNAKNETQPFCGDGIVQNGEQCELPNTETCSSECKTIERNLTCVEAKNLGLLTGSILGGNALVINNANQSFEVGLAVYEKFDENIDNQSLFDSDTGIVLNNSNLSLSVSLPSCQYQIDLFCGPVLQNFSNGTRYAERLLAAGNGGEEYCANEECGNGIKEGNEQCDDGNTNNIDSCTNQCLFTICGDGIVNNNEQCDDGNLNNSDGCTNQCILEFCGDGVKQDNESCDDGNNNNTDSCNNQCQNTFCGDYIIQSGEQCEPPNTNSCDAQCLFTICGDGIVQVPNGLGQNESCDDGNTNNTDSCNNQCEFTICGDGLVNGNEQCDDGNNNNTDSCTNQCILEFCGDGVKQDNESCDDGNNVNGDGCSVQCNLEICGDSIIQPPEVCDDGNQNNTDSCRNDCSFPICGDGIKDVNEACDDGNNNNTDSCTNQCNFPICGDGIVNNGEQCDDGNQVNKDACDNSCQFTICGDGIRQLPNTQGQYEECDDGNNNDNDACSNSCTANECIDLDQDEVCDHEDICLDSDPGEPVDSMGCDIFQFCMTKGLSCGYECFYADWKNNEPNEQFPRDCTVVVPLKNGIESQPICVPTVATEMCAN